MIHALKHLHEHGTSKLDGRTLSILHEYISTELHRLDGFCAAAGDGREEFLAVFHQDMEDLRHGLEQINRELDFRREKTDEG